MTNFHLLNNCSSEEGEVTGTFISVEGEVTGTSILNK